MGINGINDYAGLMQNGRLNSVAERRDASAQDLYAGEKKQLENAAEPSVRTSVVPSADTAGQAKRQDVPLENVSLTFHRRGDFNTIGRDSDIRSLDVEKAISDMKKDSVLQQYQYFVGSSRNLVDESADGTVIQKL